MSAQLGKPAWTTVLAALLIAGCQSVDHPVQGKTSATYEAPLESAKPAGAVFSTKPAVVRKGDGFRITFTASALTDVEVAVLDARGKIVRHLAAGLLGRNAPAPLLRNSLEQELFWDGKDDLGGATGGVAGAAPFSVRVRLGLQPKFEKNLGWSGNTLGPIRSVAVGAGGEVYVLVASWVGRGRTELRVMDRTGKYLRTIMPYRSDVPAERLKSVGQLEVDGGRIPVVFNAMGHSMSPLTAGMRKQNMAWNPKGHLVAVSSLPSAFENGIPRHLLAFHPQGGAPDGMKFVGPEIRKPTGLVAGYGEGSDPCFDHLAVSPGGEWIYFTQSKADSPHAVYRLAWDEEKASGMEAAWFGYSNRAGSDDTHLNDPQGMAVDAQGRLYICDRGNDRVLVVSPEGKPLGSIAVASPEQIAVHGGTGEIYVCCRTAASGEASKDTAVLSMDEYRAWKARVAARKLNHPVEKAIKPVLVKYSAWGQEKPRELARLEVDMDLMALDSSGAQPRIWGVVKGGLTPVDETAGRFELGAPVDDNAGLGHPGYIAADPEHNRVLVYNLSSNYKVQALDLTSGKKSLLLDCVSDFAIAPDGSIYGTGKYASRELLRFSADGKPLNFSGSSTNVSSIGDFKIGGVNLGSRGMTVSAAGDIYLVRGGTEKAVQSRLDVYGPDGKLKKAALVDGMGLGDCGVGVDPRGNIYLGVNVKPAGKLFPADLTGQVPEANWLGWATWSWGFRPEPWHYTLRNEYLYGVGAVMKFGPAGGVFYGRGSREYTERSGASPVTKLENAPEGSAEYMSGYLYHQLKVAGAQWRYPGMALVPSSERLWGDSSCVCMGSRLSVDGFGRVFVPNCFQFCVDILDTAGNRLVRAGRYGNADEPGAEVRFAWPAFVSAAGDLMCVSDSVNRRVVVTKLIYTAEESCPVP